MKIKSFILAALALTGITIEAMADTSKLLEADGWTKITTIPTSTDIANNYYVFVDQSRDLMLGIAKGVNQNTKWYSLGVYYQASVDPTTPAFLSKTWTLEAQNGGFALRNLEYSASPMQTEWNDARKYDTNDIYGSTNDWAKVLLAYTGTYWTIQNGYYPDSGYLGPWGDGNFTDGAECAANKSGNNIGKFHIYAISRDQFKQNLFDNASQNNPVDLTPWYVVNATFDAQNRTGWSEEGSGGNNNTSVGCEIWHRSSFNIHQTVTVPNGKYKVSVQAAGSTSGTVYGSNGSTMVTAATTEAAKDNYQNTVLAMINDRNWGKITTSEITVSNGSLTIGFKDETTNQWDVFDNFKLYCTGIDLSSYQNQLNSLVAEANAFIDAHVVPTVCETAISSAITTYNKTYSTAKEYSSAIVALTAVLNSYRNNTDLQSAYAAYKKMRTDIQRLEDTQIYHYTDNSNAKGTLDNAITAANQAVENAENVSAVTAQTAAIRTAGLTFISHVTAENGNSFDITFLASQNYLDWKKKDGSAAGQVTWAITNKPDDIPAFAESYEETCATTGTVLYQTVTDLPEGYYQVGMYAQANYTPGRGFTTEATEGDADRSFAFANELRTGIPISFQSEVPFSALTTLDVNVHLTETGDLTFGVQKDRNGSNWHFAQIAAITYSKDPDLTNLQATRDALVAEAMSLLNGAESSFLTEAQKNALQEAIDEGNAANTFETLNTATLTTLPEAINTAKSQIAAVKVNRVEMLEALERFETEYNLADGTDYRRLTMSAEAWTSLIEKVNAASLALDDISMAPDYGTIKDELVSQMNATDVSLRLFKSYKAMVDGTTALELATETDIQMDTDLSEQNAIESMNAAFVDYARRQAEDFSMNAFLGENLDFNTPQGNKLATEENWKIYDIAGWEETYTNLDQYCFIENSDTNYENQLYLRSNWTDKTVTLEVMKQKMLPVGKYKLSFNWNSDLNNMVNRSFYRLGDQTVTLGKATNGFETLEYIFEVADAALPFDLAFGLQKQNSGNTPAQILVDDITLTYTRIDDGVCDYFVIQDKEDLTIENAFTATTLENTRTLAQSTDAYTVCLPYSLSSNDDVQFYELSSVSSDGTMHFNEVETTEPLMPYLAVANADASLNAENVELAVTTGDMPSISVNGYTMMGTMTNISREEAINLKAYILQSGNKWRMVNSNSGSNVSIPAFRAYIVADNASTAAPQLSVSFGVATGIKNIQNLDSNNAIYDLQGRKLSPNQVKSGIYIVNGKKVAKHKFVVK